MADLIIMSRKSICLLPEYMAILCVQCLGTHKFSSGDHIPVENRKPSQCVAKYILFQAIYLYTSHWKWHLQHLNINILDQYSLHLFIPSVVFEYTFSIGYSCPSGHDLESYCCTSNVNSEFDVCPDKMTATSKTRIHFLQVCSNVCSICRQTYMQTVEYWMTKQNTIS